MTVSHPSAKPVSRKELEDPRGYQISQVIRRYSPFRADLDDNTALKFRLSPTDPDFPFDLETGLHCILNVPSGYPQNGRPTLEIQNPDMPRGFQINVEKGFDSLVERYPGKSLLALLNELDKNLETFLSAAKATTVKFVSHGRKGAVVPEPKALAPPVTTSAPVQLAFPRPALPRYSPDELKDARARRDVEIRQLEARLGRSENFSKAGDNIAFNVPLVPSSASTPTPLRSLREAALIVPEVYPLEPCTIILRGVDGDEAENVEVAFEKRAAANAHLTLMAHINYLTQNLGKMAADQRPQPRDAHATDNDADDGASVASTSEKQSHGAVVDPSRPHLMYIARPPEWSAARNRDSSDETDSSDFDSDQEDDKEDSEIESIAGGASLPAASSSGVERGISISFPGLDLKGIELLQLTSLSITVRCERCKEPCDIKNIQPSRPDANNMVRRTETCAKCTAPFAVTYRPEFIHTNSNRAGYIDLENCTVGDLLPSTFQPTCSSCSSTFPIPPGVTAVRGDSTLAICRTCHAKMTLHIPEVKYLRISTSTSTSTLPLRGATRKPKESLGITANTPLPNNGRCTHYSKSYRWFRFSCCNRVYPCDKCHDSASLGGPDDPDPHPNEHAVRMICGWCSREQRYHPDTCRMCGRSLVSKVGGTSGFWEGGKGTRDRHLMRRKEGRKFKKSATEKKALREERSKRKEGKGRGGMWWPG